MADARPLPAGVVFDCDGTLADTESLSDRAWTSVLATRGYRPTDEDFDAVIGLTFARNYRYFADRAELGSMERFRTELVEAYHEQFTAGLDLHHDALDTLRALVAADVPVGVATSSSRRGVTAVLEAAEVAELVQVVVSADDVTNHKPAPEPYLVAAEALGVPARWCSAVEDTPVGVASAKAAGMFTVAVVRAHGRPDQLSEADRVVNTVDLASLVR